MDSKLNITKETKNKIRVDYEGKLSFKERMKNKLKASNTWITAIVTFFRFVLMLGVSFVILYPFVARIAGSFMTREDILDSTVALIPKHFTIDIYKYIILENGYFDAMLNTAILSLLSALIQTLVACLVGYGLAKFKFKGNKLIMMVVILSMVIPHATLKYALLLHFKEFDIMTIVAWDYRGPIELIFGKAPNLLNTFWPMVFLSVFGLAFKNGLYIYLMRQFFKGVPDELEESAYVDGSGTLRTFFQIILPLSIPMMITVFLFSFSWQWTDKFYSSLFFVEGSASKMLLLPDIYKQWPPSIRPSDGAAGVSLYQNVFHNTAGIMIIFPLVIVYLFCQRYLVQGIERSGLVG